MKNISIIFVLLFVFFSCEEKNNINENTELNNNIPDTILLEDKTKGLREFSLKDYELDITIFVPEKYHTDEDDLPRYNIPEIIHNNGEARWEIKMPGDKYWHLVIEDMGNEISSVEKEKEGHNYKEIFDYKYYQETENSLLYSRILKADNSTLEDKEIEMLPNYHFYFTTKINNYNLVFRSFEMADFRKITVEKMQTSAINSF